MKNIFILISIFLSSQLYAQEIGRFTLQMDEEFISMPVAIPLDHFNYNVDVGSLTLYEVSTSKEEFVPSQLETGHNSKLLFILKSVVPKKTNRTFIIKLAKEEQAQKLANKINRTRKDLIIGTDDKPVLNYRYATTYPPEGFSELFKRSGFIHPLYSPGGQVLTRIQAPDHYHHYGIWAPWTRTTIDGRAVDFWNLAAGEGTVQYANTLSEVSGEIYSGFKVLQEHIDFGGKGPDKVAMNELLDLRVWNVDEKVNVIDYTSTFNTSLANGIMLDAYPYGGGLGYRAIEKWTKDNSSVLTSEGKTRIDADGSRARWCIVEGESDVQEGRSGILFLSHPSNRMHPEPMRVWPIDANGGRGDMYFEFTPIRYEAWEFKPLRDYTLKYRMIVFDGEMNKETAEKYWRSFAKYPIISVL
jgi:hypothetical protein